MCLTGWTTFQNFKHGPETSRNRNVVSISINGDIIASSNIKEKCHVWSITKRKKLYSVNHKDSVNHVRLFPDSTLGFDLITASDDQTLSFWRGGVHIKSLEHSGPCNHFDLDDTNRLLAVACERSLTTEKTNFFGKTEKLTSVTVWRLDNFTQVDQVKFGCTAEVRFNADSTKIIAVKKSGEVIVINLE